MRNEETCEKSSTPLPRIIVFSCVPTICKLDRETHDSVYEAVKGVCVQIGYSFTSVHVLKQLLQSYHGQCCSNVMFEDIFERKTVSSRVK